jgi:hypothetical protein
MFCFEQPTELLQLGIHIFSQPFELLFHQRRDCLQSNVYICKNYLNTILGSAKYEVWMVSKRKLRLMSSRQHIAVNSFISILQMLILNILPSPLSSSSLIWKETRPREQISHYSIQRDIQPSILLFVSSFIFGCRHFLGIHIPLLFPVNLHVLQIEIKSVVHLH